MKHMLSGQVFDYSNPEPHYVWDIGEMAGALGKICRFGGHCKSFYSVAQHSVIMSCCVPIEFAMEALLHDAEEIIVSDLDPALKKLCGKKYNDLAKRVDAEIRTAFGLPDKMSPEVKDADQRMLATEARDLMIGELDPEVWKIIEGVDPYDFKIAGVTPNAAIEMFVSRYAEIVREMQS